MGNTGGFCDCEILLNGYELCPEYWVPDTAREQERRELNELDQDKLDEDEEQTWPIPLPQCVGVRVGSTQPCALWCRLRRGVR